MKGILKVFALLLLAVLPLSLMAQGASIILNYMKVAPGMEGSYVETEMQWKKIHEKRVEAGLMAGWQLWRNVYAAADDPYQFITIDWFDDWGQSLAENPEGFWEEHLAGLFTDEEAAEMMEMTMRSRTLARKDVMHRVMQADNGSGSRYILVNAMKVKPGMEGAYLDAEGKYSKPLQEARIEDGQMSHWSVWQAWPYKEGQITYSTVDGYSSIAQMTGGGDNLLEKVFPGMTMAEWAENVSSERTQASIELWELVDSVFPPSPEE